MPRCATSPEARQTFAKTRIRRYRPSVNRFGTSILLGLVARHLDVRHLPGPRPTGRNMVSNSGSGGTPGSRRRASPRSSGRSGTGTPGRPSRARPTTAPGPRRPSSRTDTSRSPTTPRENNYGYADIFGPDRPAKVTEPGFNRVDIKKNGLRLQQQLLGNGTRPRRDRVPGRDRWTDSSSRQSTGLSRGRARLDTENELRAFALSRSSRF